MSRRERLLDELRNFEPADSIEASNVAAVVNLLTTAADPFSRGRFDPGHITASCYIVDPGGRLLLHHHRRLGRWLQMGGHVESNELTREAALREGREESGLADLVLDGGILDVDVHAIPASKGDPLHHHFDVRYIARTEAPESVSMRPDESNDLAWLTLARANELMDAPESARVIRKLGVMLG
ncbi:MAG TPA: NUDIX domain-containing protein [Thermoanaerobaculia bacterium]|nr:NUDIX domain-containing protein [Thermoanaerobaculia bacterium]